MIYHGCGNATKIFEDFIEIGLDSYNPLEAKSGLDVVDLRRKYGHRMGFCGNMDVLKWANAPAGRAAPVGAEKAERREGRRLHLPVRPLGSQQRFRGEVPVRRRARPEARDATPSHSAPATSRSRERRRGDLAGTGPDRVRPPAPDRVPVLVRILTGVLGQGERRRWAWTTKACGGRLGDDFRRVDGDVHGPRPRAVPGRNVEEPIRHRADRHRLRPAAVPSPGPRGDGT